MAQSKTKNVISWVFQVMLAGLFIMMAVPKLMSDPETVANFTRWGMPDNLYLVIGSFEILGAIGLLIPRTAAAAASGLIPIMIGALFTHLTHDETMMVILPLSVMIILAGIAYFRNPFSGRGSVPKEA